MPMHHIFVQRRIFLLVTASRCIAAAAAAEGAQQRTRPILRTLREDFAMVDIKEG